MRLVLAVFIIVYAILDCLDGQHARNTKQTSKLGELLDHCTDALGIPLTTAACCWAMQADNVREADPQGVNSVCAWVTWEVVCQWVEWR
jgi:phosphatidylglycerophosphate synthase